MRAINPAYWPARRVDPDNHDFFNNAALPAGMAGILTVGGNVAELRDEYLDFRDIGADPGPRYLLGSRYLTRPTVAEAGGADNITGCFIVYDTSRHFWTGSPGSDAPDFYGASFAPIMLLRTTDPEVLQGFLDVQAGIWLLPPEALDAQPALQAGVEFEDLDSPAYRVVADIENLFRPEVDNLAFVDFATVEQRVLAEPYTVTREAMAAEMQRIIGERA